MRCSDVMPLAQTSRLRCVHLSSHPTTQLIHQLTPHRTPHQHLTHAASHHSLLPSPHHSPSNVHSPMCHLLVLLVSSVSVSVSVPISSVGMTALFSSRVAVSIGEKKAAAPHEDEIQIYTACIHTYTRIHTYIHTYKHAYIHTYIQVMWQLMCGWTKEQRRQQRMLCGRGET